MSNQLRRSIASAKKVLNRVSKQVEREERQKAQRDELRALEAKIRKEKETLARLRGSKSVKPRR